MSNRTFAVIGYPLGHTMSPPIHKRLFELANQPFSYETLEIPPALLDETVPRLQKLTGFNITIPHKLAILPHLAQIDPAAQRYGAVNCVSCDDQGRMTGYNTDVDGFLRSIQPFCCDFTKPVCIVGAGGAGRMFSIEAARKGAPVTIAVRNPQGTAAAVKEDILRQCPDAQVEVQSFEQLEAGDVPYELLANATPVGMYPKAGSSPVSDRLLSRCRCVFDAVYNPTRTRLLELAEEAGCQTAGGMSMLVWQAVTAHEIWDRSSYRQQDILQLIDDMIAQVNRQFGGAK